MSAKRSGIQLQVLHLYRRALRLVRTKPPSARPNFLLLIQHEFHVRGRSVSRRDVSAIEYMLRRGDRWIEGLEDASVRSVGVTEEVKAWGREAKMRQADGGKAHA